MFFAEFVYTDPFFYADNSPFGASIWYRRKTNQRYPLFGWIGHPNGRDAITFALGSRFVFEDKLVLNTVVSYVVQGEQGIVWDWGVGERWRQAQTPTGTPEHIITAGILADWVPPILQPRHGRLALQGGIGGRVVVNSNHASGVIGGVEVLLGVRYNW